MGKGVVNKPRSKIGTLILFSGIAMLPLLKLPEWLLLSFGLDDLFFILGAL